LCADGTKRERKVVLLERKVVSTEPAAGRRFQYRYKHATHLALTRRLPPLRY